MTFWKKAQTTVKSHKISSDDSILNLLHVTRQSSHATVIFNLSPSQFTAFD
jgi:hypothetical protein